MATLSEIKDNSPNPSTVTLLADLLEKAKAGEVRSIVYAVGYNDSCTSQGWGLDGRNDNKRLLAEIALLQHELAHVLLLAQSDSVVAEHSVY